MKTYNEGLVVGKFWPPHLGHSYLIHQAKARCVYLHVWVVFRLGEKPTALQRIRALKEMHPNVHIRGLMSPGDEYDDDSEHWAEVVRNEGLQPDAVFTSEAYGDPWAQALGCDHVAIDIDRAKVPISGTKVRENIHANWGFLIPPIKPALATKICVVGGESCGKSTLVPHLADLFDASYTTEAGRDWVESFGTDPDDEGIWSYIMDEQPRREDKAAIASNNGLVFCDTDLLTTSVWWQAWHEKINNFYLYVLNNAALRHAQTYSHYLVLSHVGVPWIDDGTRSESAKREFFTNGILNAVAGTGVPYTVIEGSFMERTEKAVDVVNRLISEISIFP